MVLNELMQLMKGHVGHVSLEVPTIAVSTLCLTYLIVLLLSRLPKSEKWLG